MSGSTSRVARPGPAPRSIAVRGGAVDPDAFCEQALRALHAAASDQPRLVFEAYLAHLSSRGAHLEVLVEAADDLPPATAEWLARWGRRPAGALRLVAAGGEATPRLRIVDSEEPRQAAEPPGPRTSAPAPVARGRRRSGWSVRVAGIVAAAASALLWSLAGNEHEQPRASLATAPDPTSAQAAESEREPVEAESTAPHAGPASLAGSVAGRGGAEVGGASHHEPGSTAPAIAPLAVALAALETGDADAYKRAIRRIDGPSAVQAEAVLLRRLEAPPREAPASERSARMLAAWGLASVGGRGALDSLDAAARDADPHVAALAARSAAVIRARLAAGESGAGRP